MEFVLWGLPEGETDRLHEKVLTCTPEQQRVEAVKVLAMSDGWHSFRITKINGEVPDFGAAVRGNK